MRSEAPMRLAQAVLLWTQDSSRDSQAQDQVVCSLSGANVAGFGRRGGHYVALSPTCLRLYI